jgi:hypothetical protein
MTAPCLSWRVIDERILAGINSLLVAEQDSWYTSASLGLASPDSIPRSFTIALQCIDICVIPTNLT